MAAEPKKVIRQSRATTEMAARDTDLKKEGEMKPNRATVKAQNRYPHVMKGLRRPILSEIPPIRKVVKVAVMAERATIIAIYDESWEIVL